MKNTYQTNASLLMEKFPALGLMASQWSEKERIPSTLKLPNLENVDLLYVYGISDGDIFDQCKPWLEKEGKKLIFLEDEPGFIASFLHSPKATEVLSHPKVFIELLDDVENLATKYPERRIELIGPSFKKKKRALRLKILRKTTLSHALHVDRLYGYQPFYNFVQNVRKLPGSFYANGLKNSFKGTAAIVCGAGPSLESSIETLKTLEDQALILAGGSTVAALSSKGIIPHFGMALDPNFEEYLRFKKSLASDMPLLYSTRVHPKVFETCNGPFGYLRGGIGGGTELWIEEALGLTEPLLGDFLSPESVSVTTICVAWAQFLGCNPIIFCGLDLAYTNNRHYAEGVVDESSNVPYSAIEAEKSVSDRILKRRGKNGKTLYTAVRWVMEAASLAHFAKKHKEIQFFNATAQGLPIRGVEDVCLTDFKFEKRDIKGQIAEAIQKNSMPPQSEKIIEMKMKEMKESLERLIGYLEILSGKKKGSSALAEIELQEEMAFHYLFYDIKKVLQEENFWGKWLDLCLKYHAMYELSS